MLKQYLKIVNPRQFLAFGGLFLVLGAIRYFQGDPAAAFVDGILALGEVAVYYLALAARDE